jgi:hypothetical protein
MGLRHKVVFHFRFLIIALFADLLVWSLAIAQNHVEEDSFTAIVVLKSYQAAKNVHIFFLNLRWKLKRLAREFKGGL